MRPEPGESVIYLDGDDVGARIELHLLRGEIEDAAEVSGAVVRAIGGMAERVRTDLGGRVIFAAGDELLALLPSWPSSEDILALRSEFESATGLTVSCGIGRTSEDAASSLRMAKLLGKNRTVETIST